MPFDSVLFLGLIVGSLTVFALVLAYASIVAPGQPADTTRKASVDAANEQAHETKRAA